MSVFSSEENSSYIGLLQIVRKPLKRSEPPLQRVRNPLKVSEPPPRLKNSLAIVITYHFIKLTKLAI